MSEPLKIQVDPVVLDGEVFKRAMQLEDVRALKRSARLMARAWRDLYNQVGAIPEVAAAFERVRRIVEDHE